MARYNELTFDFVPSHDSFAWASKRIAVFCTWIGDPWICKTIKVILGLFTYSFLSTMLCLFNHPLSQTRDFLWCRAVAWQLRVGIKKHSEQLPFDRPTQMNVRQSKWSLDCLLTGPCPPRPLVRHPWRPTRRPSPSRVFKRVKGVVYGRCDVFVFEDSKGVGGKQDKKLCFFFEIS